ncbi:MAG: hypothetical protein AABY37_08530 [Actinomycetota bacterium]
MTDTLFRSRSIEAPESASYVEQPEDTLDFWGELRVSREVENKATDGILNSEKFSEFPEGLVKSYIEACMRRTLAEITEDGRYFLTIPVLGQVWAEAETEKKAELELKEILSQWVMMKIEDQDRDLPVVETIDLNRL